jgi:sulfate permease, SulP family
MTRNQAEQGLIYRLFPFLSWLQGYGGQSFQSDAVAGLTVAVVLIPQSMAYAMLAGLPPVYGLYAAAITPMVAALWGSLRQLATGPIAIMSLLVLTSLTPLAEPGSPRFIELALLLSLIVGVIYLAIGLFRMGILMSFISHSAVKGFTSAAALIITATQLPHFLGISIGRHESFIYVLIDLVKHLPQVHFPTLAIGLGAFGIIYGLKKIKDTLPGGLVAMVLATAAVVILDLDASGVAIVGKSPSGLPAPHLPVFDPETMSVLLGPAIVIALVSFAETYSVGKAISGETKQKLNVDQEFIGQGLANLVGGIFQSYPVSGSFSRSAINFAAGAKTGISSVISCVGVIIALLFLTPLLTHIPKAALAALVISAVLLLFHPGEVFALWKMNRHDGIVAVIVFVLALVTKPDYALLIGVMASLMFFLWKTMHPRIVRVSKDPDLNMFINADFHGKPSCPQILQLRSDNSIYFANAEYTVEHILERLDEQETPVKHLLLDLQAMGFIDITGVEELRALLEDVRARGVEVALMEVRIPVKEVMDSAGFTQELKPGHLLQKRGDAVGFLFQHVDQDYCRDTCPHRLFLECGTIK